MNREKKMKEAPLAILGVGVLIFVFALALPGASATSEAEVVIGDAEAYQGDITSTLIKINNAKNVGVIDLDISYDPLVVMVIDVTGSDFDTTIPNLDHNDTGSVRIGALQMESPGLDRTVITMANIKLKAVGNAGSTSPLNIIVTEFEDATPEGKHINYTTTNGTFTVKSSNGGSGNGGGGGTTPTPTPTPTSTEKPPAVSGEEKVEVAETPSPTLAPTFTPSATPTQTPSPTIPPTTIEQKQTLMLVIGLVVVLIVAIIIYAVFKRRKK